MNERKYELDIMRIMSVLGVITIHVSTGILERIASFAVPLFVMISGALWLDRDKEVTIKKLWTKNIFRIITAFLFWSLLYSLFYYDNAMTMKQYIYTIITGHYHMWFCYTIVGVYMFIPIIRKLKESNELYLYFILLSMIIMIVLPSLLKIPFLNALGHNTNLLFYKMGIGFIFYFVLGDLLYHFDMRKKQRMILYLCGIASFVFTYISNWESGDFDFFLMIYVSAIFVFIKAISGRINIKCSKLKNILKSIGSMCFGIYLVHVMVMDVVTDILTQGTIYMDLLIILIVFGCSLGICCVLSKISWAKRYIL